MRLDNYLVEMGLILNRSRAQQAIREGRTSVNGRPAAKNGMEVTPADRIEYHKPEKAFVSRGGYKLLAALNANKIELTGKIVLDIGASSGGFTDCCLQAGAKRVYAYDVGHDQLDWSLRTDSRVICREGINCRTLTAADFPESIEFICMDVSFISCTKMIDAICSILGKDAEAVILFKPQFEVGPRYLNRQGIVSDDKITKERLNETIRLIEEKPMKCIAVTESPIRGGDGNREYLLYLRRI